METFGRWLKHQRISHDLTQEALAERIGCSVSLLKKLETHQRRPSKQIITRLATIFKVDAAVVVKWRTTDPTHEVNPVGAYLPIPLTPLVGRATDVAALQILLSQDTVRFLTLTGPGGVGKTRLSLALGAACQLWFPDGVWYVPLAPVHDADGVLPAIMHVLRLPTPPDQTVLETIQNMLRHRHALLILDNFEHVLAAAPMIATLLESTTQLKIVTTSRALLHIPGEHCMVVHPLSLVVEPTGEGVHAAHSAAMELFLQRAIAVNPQIVITDEALAAIRTICVELEGLPLAIELAAARCQIVTPQELRTVFRSRLMLAKSTNYTRPQRHSSVWDALLWSYQLLDPMAQSIFRTLGVCVDGVLLPTLQAMLANEDEAAPSLIDHLHLLANHSLISLEPTTTGVLALTMLETLREFAHLLLIRHGEELYARRRHADHYRAFLVDINIRLEKADSVSWVARFDHEAANIDHALHWLMTYDPAVASQFASHLAPVWMNRGSIQYGTVWLERCITLPRLDPLLEAMLARDLGAFWITAGRYADAEAVLIPALVMFKSARRERDQVRIYFMLAYAAIQQNRFVIAEQYLARCEDWAHSNAEIERLTIIFHNQAQMFEQQGDYETARMKVQAMLNLCQILKYPANSVLAWTRQGLIDLAQGIVDAAEHALSQARRMLEQTISFDRGDLVDMRRLDGLIALAHGDHRRAQVILGQTLAMAAELNDIPRVVQTLDACLWYTFRAKDLHISAALLGLQQRLRRHYAMPAPPPSQSQLDSLATSLTNGLEPDVLGHWMQHGATWVIADACRQILAD